MGKIFKHNCITELNLIEKHTGIWLCKCLHAFDNQTQEGTDTMACRAQLCYCHSFSIAPRWERQQKSAERLLISVLSKLQLILWRQAEWTGAPNLLPKFWANIYHWGWHICAGCIAHKDHNWDCCNCKPSVDFREDLKWIFKIPLRTERNGGCKSQE